MMAVTAAWRNQFGWRMRARLKIIPSIWLRLDLFTPQWGHVLRSVLAAALALGIGFVCQVETPYSAASTVLLVANASQGAVLAKGFWRVAGTLVGGIVAILLMGLFAQTPALFLLAFGLWLGLCTGGAMIFRHFRASGTAVAGYTIGLATYGSLEHPDTSLEHALGRIATVVLGVVCLAVVTALFSARVSPSRFHAGFARLIGAVGRVMTAKLSGEARRDMAPAVGLVPELFALDDLLELASAESAEVALRAGAVREGMAALLAGLVGATAWSSTGPLHPIIERAASRIRQAVDTASEALNSIDGVEQARASIAAARHDLQALVVEAESLEGAEKLDVPIQLDRMIELAEDYEAALVGLARLRSGRLDARRSYRFHRDWRAGLDNGLRSFLAIVLGGAFWIATAWPDGSLMLLVLAPYCALLAMAGNPAAGAVEFVKGTVVAVPASFICAFIVLPQIDGFPLLIVALVPFWIAGLYATTKPKFAAASLAYLVAFNTLVGAANPMTYNFAAWCNQVCGWLAGVIVTLLCFRIILPRNPGKEAGRIAVKIRDDVLAIARRDGRWDRHAWEHLQHHRLSRIALALKGDPARQRLMMEDGLAGIHAGRALLRIRNTLRQNHFPATALSLTLAVLADSKSWSLAPAEAANTLRAIAELLLSANSGDPSAQGPVHQVAVALADLSSLIGAHPGFFALAESA
ncbi:FUSC family protein [Rhizobium sp. A37_96]